MENLGIALYLDWIHNLCNCLLFSPLVYYLSFSNSQKCNLHKRDVETWSLHHKYKLRFDF